uniref:NADH-ubiquinone oxidoreductase chain 6 n=1 Tax=Nebrioporus millingeni TaxID=2201847 RepID=A0A894JPU9_9DYTI|nr:NADH dehydrogenase subunit 6 [Nebrioporus millingeni]
MLLMYYLMNLMMTIMFLFMNHPMSMGMTLMIQTIIISLISGFYSYSFWFSYILFLIMIGGMMVLFMYMTSLASNEKFKFSKKMIMMILFLLMIMMLLNMSDMSIINFNIKNSNSMEIMNKLMMFKNENMNSLNSMYNNPNFMITIMLINYLLITLIAVVKITKSKMGPLRQKF